MGLFLFSIISDWQNNQFFFFFWFVRFSDEEKEKMRDEVYVRFFQVTPAVFLPRNASGITNQIED